MVVLLLSCSRVTGDAARAQPAHRLVGERLVNDDVASV
jgi:hypothetical protein